MRKWVEANRSSLVDRVSFQQQTQLTENLLQSLHALRANSRGPVAVLHELVPVAFG